MRNHLLSLGFVLLSPLPALADGCFGPGTAMFHCSVQGGAKACGYLSAGRGGLLQFWSHYGSRRDRAGQAC